MVRQGGFTLIEVLVVTALIVILTGMGIASYRRFDATRKVEAAAVGFGTILRTTQKKADAGVRPSGCASDQPLSGYWVDVASNSTYADEYALCTTSPSNYPKNTYTLAHGSYFVDELNVEFMTFSQGVKITDGVTQIAMNGTTTSYQVSVTSGGAITVEKI